MTSQYHPGILWAADVLGWSEPGLVIVLLVVVGGFLFLNLVVWLVTELPDALSKKTRKAKGPVSGAFWTILLVIATVIALCLNIMIMIGFLFAVVVLAGTVREWWWKGK
jgi:uncharacterized membrane-anchored protein